MCAGVAGILTPVNEPPHVCVERILREAIEAGASDLYWIPDSTQTSVRRRCAGVQQTVASFPREHADQCVARIKVLAGLLTYRTKAAQDGAIRELPGVGEVDVRVSIMPTRSGERAALRFFRNEREPRRLDELGFHPDALASMQAMLKLPSGLVVLTGPTGSGKTTTIYAMVRELLEREQDPASIVTIEDPIECRIDSISQTAVSHESAWGYAAALRSALRQDVKTLVVGEMRDRDVVKVTIDAALSGHRVITTFHAGDIPSVYARLLHLGVEPFLVAAAISGVVSQRLVSRAGGRAPVAATLVPNDEWRDFVATSPRLSELRSRLRSIPGADLDQVMRSVK